MNNLDMGQLLKLVSNMDKKELENAFSKANEIMNSKDKEKIINELKNNMK